MKTVPDLESDSPGQLLSESDFVLCEIKRKENRLTQLFLAVEIASRSINTVAAFLWVRTRAGVIYLRHINPRGHLSFV